MVLWKDEQYWETFNQTQEKKKEWAHTNKQNQKRNRNYNQNHRNTKDHKKLPWTTIHQQTRQPRGKE